MFKSLVHLVLNFFTAGGYSLSWDAQFSEHHLLKWVHSCCIFLRNLPKIDLQIAGKERLVLAWVFETSKATPSHWHASNKAPPPNPSHTVLLTRGQTFKHMSLWEPISFKSPHIPLWFFQAVACTLINSQEVIKSTRCIFSKHSKGGDLQILFPLLFPH